MSYTNLDALYLSTLADELDGEPRARLHAIADRIQRMDERNALLSQHQTFDQGYLEAMRQLRGRSNIEPQTVNDGEAPFDAIEALARQGRKPQRIPKGVSGLSGAPSFNPPRKQRKPLPTVDLDLSFLGDL